MEQYVLPAHFAQVYNCGAYGAANYSESEASCETSTAANASEGSLPNTGMPIFISTGVSIAIIIIALYLFKKRKK
jgi:LPXTG-motif cell wall-anchored protein